MPLVSVIVPVFNAERHLPECLDSLRRQTLTDFELILVDDGCTDASPQILSEYAALDSRLSVIAGPATGSAGSARNAGIEVATGDYLSFLDADDVFAPTLLEELHTRAVTDAADVVLSKFRLFQGDVSDAAVAEWSLRLEYLPRKRPFAPAEVGDLLFFAANPATWNKLYRREYILDKGLRFQPLKRANDVCFTFLSLAQAERLSYIDRALINYRTNNPESLQGTVDREPLEFVQALEGVRSGLRAAGLFDQFERAFVNQALVICLSNLKRQRTPAGFLTVYEALRNEFFDRMGILGRADDYFVRDDLRQGLHQVLELSPQEYLFERVREAGAAVDKAQAETREAMRAAQQRAGALQPVAEVADAAAAVAPSQTPGTPDVSVIVPVHNTERFLAECLDSVLRQTGVSLELVCIDDGSSDGSAAILDTYAQRDPRVRVVHQANAGQSGARNVGLGLAGGRYVCFIDSDDYWTTDGLAALVAHADSAALEVLAFDAVSIREPGVDDELWRSYAEYYRRQAYPEVRTGPQLVADLADAKEYRVSPCLYLIRRDLLWQPELRFFPGITHEDNLFSFELMRRATRVAHLQTALYARRVRPGSIMTSSGKSSAARGYFVCYVEMLRSLVADPIADPRTAAAMAGLAAGVFRSARNNIVGLSEDAVELLDQIDPAPDAQTAYLMLRRLWRDERLARATRKQLRDALAGTPPVPDWRQSPLVQPLRPLVRGLRRYQKKLLGRR